MKITQSAGGENLHSLSFTLQLTGKRNTGGNNPVFQNFPSVTLSWSERAHPPSLQKNQKKKNRNKLCS